MSAFAGVSGSGGFGGWNGGGYGGNGGGGGGDWSLPGSGGAHPSNVLADLAVNEAPEMVEEVILLDVGGMRCGGCVGHVKKILEQQENVTEASVNLATETALVRVSVPKGAQGEAALKALGDKLVEVVRKEGFTCALKRKAQPHGHGHHAQLQQQRK